MIYILYRFHTVDLIFVALLTVFFDDDSQPACETEWFFAIFDEKQIKWGRAGQTTG